MPKVLLLSCILICLVCGCNAPQKLRTITLAEVQFYEGKTINPNNTTREYQPSGSSKNTETEIESKKYSVETNASNFDTESPSFQTSDNSNADKNTLCYADTVMIKSLAMIELNEANQSFTFGLTSFIALLAAAILALPGIFIFSITFLIASFALGILGLRKGIIAKRIIAEQKEIYSNSGKATWGIILSLGIFAAIVAAAATVIYLIFGSGGF